MAVVSSPIDRVGGVGAKTSGAVGGFEEFEMVGSSAVIRMFSF